LSHCYKDRCNHTDKVQKPRMHAAQPETQLYMSQLDGDRDLTCVRAFAQPFHLLFSLGSFEILDSVFTF
jgi:hypothetical protein